MPVTRQLLTGLPRQNGATAFMPLRALTQSVMAVETAQGTPEGITGQPGTQGVAAPYPMATPPDPARPYFIGGGLSRSWLMPARWYPVLYYRGQHLAGTIGGVTVYSDNLMPMPAIDPRGLQSGITGMAGFAASRAGASGTPTAPARPHRVIRVGDRQITWPRRMPPWRDWKQR